MNELTDLEREFGGVLIESLTIEVSQCADMNPGAGLLNECLVIVSIDARVVGMLLSWEFGVKLRSDDPEMKQVFSSLRALAKHVESNKKA